MTRKALTDRDMLERTLLLIDTGVCCGFFACPGPGARPVPMASCAQASAAYELRRYLERHGGWCPEHGIRLDMCHPAAERPDPDGVAPVHTSHPGLCYCNPVIRNRRGAITTNQEA